MIGDTDKHPSYAFDDKSTDILMTSISTDDCDITLKVDHLGNIKLEVNDEELVTVVFDGFQGAILGRALMEYAKRAKTTYSIARKKPMRPT